MPSGRARTGSSPPSIVFPSTDRSYPISARARRISRLCRFGIARGHVDIRMTYDGAQAVMPTIARANEEGRDRGRSRPQQAPDTPSRRSMESSIEPSTVRSRIGTSSDIRRRTGGRAERPAGAHRRCRLREPEHVRRPDPNAELHPRRRRRVALQPVPRHRAVLADARGAVDRAEQPRGRVRIDRRIRRGFPGLLRDPARGTARRCRGSCGTTDTARPRSGSGI